MGRARKRNRAAVFAERFFRWFGRGAALYAVIWVGMRYIGRPWLGWELLWSFLICTGAVVIVGVWGETFSAAEE